MPSEKEPFYDPVPPTYDEALAGSSRADWHPPASPYDDRPAAEAENEGLLSRNAAPATRRPGGYRPPTAETDDEGSDDGLNSLWDSDDSDRDEADHVRREMQEMDVEDSSESRASSWGKRMSFLSLPAWKWSWRPRLPRFTIQLPQRPSDADDGALEGDDGRGSADADGEGATETQTRRWVMPKINGIMAILIFARVLVIVLVLAFIYFLFASDVFGGLTDRMRGGFRFNPEDVRNHIQNNIDPAEMRHTVKHFSSYAHIAGTEGDYATALDIQTMFTNAGLDEVEIDEYLVYLNYPRKDGRAVQIMDEKDHKVARWSAKLEEEDTGEETAGRQTFAFHGHSKSGDVKGPLLYANYGSREDYKKLKDMGIDTKGAIALVRYYGTQTDRALKVKGAELAGFAGCIIYSDPADDGFLKGEVAPAGRYMPKDGVQRGAVSLMSWVVGDVLTPGWPSKEGRPRMVPNESPGLVGIPSLPLAWGDAEYLLRELQGHGQKVPEHWQGGVPDVKEWWTGDSSSPIVRLKNEQDENEQQPIWNVYGRIIGMEQTQKSVIIGNHRDAWAFGATDPHTGTAILVEMARIFGDLVSRGWRPLRTIEFMSWDAEEYNLIGSTEFVENNIKRMRQDAYAYINVDVGVSGSELRAAGSPLMQKTLLHAMNRVADPFLNVTLKQLWDDRGDSLEGLGAGSDYVAFQDIAGVSSLDLEFAGDQYPYHSSYDTFELVDTVTDPGFVYHSMLAQVVGLVLLDLSDRAILPFDMPAYANRLKGWVEDLEKWVGGETGRDSDSHVPLGQMKDAAGLIKVNAEEFDKWEADWDRLVLQSGGWEAKEVGAARLTYNAKMVEFEKTFLDLEMGGGVSHVVPLPLAMLTRKIPNRTQFKHVIFGPQLWSGYDEAFFPAIRDLVEVEDWEAARRYVNKTATLMRMAAEVLTA